MIKTTMFTIPILTGLIIATVMLQSSSAQGGEGMLLQNGGPQAIPDWIKNNFEWYINDQIDEKTLLTSLNWMFDNNIMHLSEEAAQEVNDLKEINIRLHHGISSLIQEGQLDENGFELLTGVDVEPVPAAIAIPNLLDARKSGNESAESGYTGGVTVASGDITGDGTSEALNHLRKAYDLNPNDLTVVLQHDSAHDKWIPILQVKWSSTGETLIEDFTTKPEAKTVVFPHMLEQSSTQAASNGTTTSTITFVGLESSGPIVDSILRQGGTTSAWEEGIAAFANHGMSESVAEDLESIVVLCNTEIDKKTHQIASELALIEQWLKIIEEDLQTSSYDAAGRLTSTTDTAHHNQSDLDFIQRKLISIDQHIKSLSTGVGVLDEKVQGIDQLPTNASKDMILKGKKILQNLVEDQQNEIDDLSEDSKMLHDTAMSIIRKIG